MITVAAAELESRRVQCLQQLCAQKSLAERNRLGQFGTPRPLADQIVQVALSYLAPSGPIRFLEPGFGTGPFFAALRASTSRMTIAQGFETDAAFVTAARRLWRACHVRIDHTDFTERQPPAREAARFNLILCNPPYQRHHHLGRRQKQRLQRQVSVQLGLQVSGLAGLYAYFLLLSKAWMTRDGVAGWLVPAEFLEVNYGSALRDFLLNHVTLQRIHRFDADDCQFADALVSSVVVFVTNAPPSDGHQCLETRGGSLERPRAERWISTRNLSAKHKWNRSTDCRADRSGRRTISDWFSIKRGIATGCNRFFILPADRAAELNLPVRYFQPILPSPRYLRDSVIGAGADGRPDIDLQQFLITSNLPLGVIRERLPSLYDYLQSGIANAVDRGYLCSRRKPWYACDKRQSAPLLCSYMGRPNQSNASPFRFFWNRSRAVAPNVYLMMYPQGRLAEALEHDAEIGRRVLGWLQQIEPKRLIASGRTYGGGLHKLEPKELGAVEVEPLEFSL